MPNGQARPTRSRGWSIGIVTAVIVVAVVGWAWGYGGYDWKTWWNKNTSNHAANTTPNSASPGPAPNKSEQQGQQAQQSHEQSEGQHPSGQQGQESNVNQTAQNPANTNQTAQNPASTKQATSNQPNNEQTIAPDSLSRNEVRQVQVALKKNGFGAGPVDGRWGPETSDALKRFQRSKNMQASGQLDQKTLSGLGLSNAQFVQQNQNNSSQTR